MKVILPEANWLKHVESITPEGSSGYTWNGPANNRSGFIGSGSSSSVELPDGALIVAHKLKAKAVAGCTALYAVISGPRIVQLGICDSNKEWSDVLRPKAEEFLASPLHIRCVTVCQRLIRVHQATLTAKPGIPSDDIRNEMSQLVLLAQKYAQLNETITPDASSLQVAAAMARATPNPEVTIQAVERFITASFRLWINRMVRENSLSQEDVRRIIGASVDEMVTAEEVQRPDSPWRQSTPERRLRLT